MYPGLTFSSSLSSSPRSPLLSNLGDIFRDSCSRLPLSLPIHLLFPCLANRHRLRVLHLRLILYFLPLLWLSQNLLRMLVSRVSSSPSYLNPNSPHTFCPGSQASPNLNFTSLQKLAPQVTITTVTHRLPNATATLHRCPLLPRRRRSQPGGHCFSSVAGNLLLLHFFFLGFTSPRLPSISFADSPVSSDAKPSFPASSLRRFIFSFLPTSSPSLITSSSSSSSSFFAPNASHSPLIPPACIPPPSSSFFFFSFMPKPFGSHFSSLPITLLPPTLFFSFAAFLLFSFLISFLL